MGLPGEVKKVGVGINDLVCYELLVILTRICGRSVESPDVWQPGVYYTYIMASKSRATYVGMTNNLERRVNEHRLEGENGYCGKWKITRLVYVEEFSHPRDAIEREKQWKGWSKAKKHALVTDYNPGWTDLAPVDE